MLLAVSPRTLAVTLACSHLLWRLAALTTRHLPPWDGHGSLDITKASGTSWTSGGVMPGAGERLERYSCARFAPALWFALFASCAATSAPSAATPDAQHGTAGSVSVNNSSSSSSTKVAQTAPSVPADVNCPAVEVRRGAATLAVGPTGERTAMTMKYQASFVRLARECSTVEGNMVMKVGVEGRIVLGPAGSPGQVSVPLRFAVVQETPSSGMRPIATKFIMVPVDVGCHRQHAVRLCGRGAELPDPNAGHGARRVSRLCRLRSGFGRGAIQGAESAAAEGKAEAQRQVQAEPATECRRELKPRIYLPLTRLRLPKRLSCPLPQGERALPSRSAIPVANP